MTLGTKQLLILSDPLSMLTMLNKRPGEDFRLEFFASPDPPFI